MKNFLQSFIFATKGLKITIRERNFKIELCCMFLVLFAGFFFKISSTEWAILCGCFALVLAAETFNTAIEKLAHTFRDQQKIPYQKFQATSLDISAAAVFLTAFFSIIIGLIIFLPYFFELF